MDEWMGLSLESPRILVPNHAEIVSFFAGHDVEISVSVEIEGFESIEFYSCNSGDVVDSGDFLLSRFGNGKPEDSHRVGRSFTTGDEVHLAIAIDIGKADGLGSSNLGVDDVTLSLPAARCACSACGRTPQFSRSAHGA